MDLLQRNHQLLLKGINYAFLHYLHARIEREDRLIGVFGSRGVGRTTLLLQHIKLKLEDSREALYVNLDDFWFETHLLTNAVKEFLQVGGHYLFLDEIHSYSSRIEEVSTLLDANPASKTVFATISLYSQTVARNGLRYEAVFYTMYLMSFREFLSYESILDKDPTPLEDILTNHHDLVKETNAEMNIVPIYRNYLEHGCYPLYWQSPDMYYLHLQKLVREEIYRDLSLVVSIPMSNLERAQKYFMMAAESVPSCPKSTDVTRKTNMLR